MKFSEDHIKKIKQSKINYAKNKYKWENIEPYLDIQINNKSRNRKQKFITLREFKEIRVGTNLTLKDLARKGYSKQILGFCSRFCSGGMRITEKQFKLEYKKIDLNEISKKYNIDRGDVACLRQLYQIKEIPGAYSHRVKNEKELTKRQEEIIYGSLLGDACGSDLLRLSFKHGDCQRGYIFWKFDELKNLCNKNVLKAGRSYSEKYNLDNVYWMFRTKYNSNIEKINKLYYKSGKKEISLEITNHLTPFSIAVWYMDDGCTNFRHYMRCLGKKATPIMYFCTDSFSLESCKNLSICLGEKFNIKNRITNAKKLKDGTTPYNITIENKFIQKFVDLIEPYILPMFRYKIDYKDYLVWKNNT